MRLFRLLPLLAFAPLGAQTAGVDIVSPEWLARQLKDPRVVVLHVGHGDNDYAAGHIPGARELSYMAIAVRRDSLSTELPTIEALQRVFEKLGVSDDSHVVLYSHGEGMAPMASRAFFSLDRLGVQRISLLNGGFNRWRSEGRPVSTETPKVAPGRITPRPRDVSVDASWVHARAKAGGKGVAFIDTRTTPEYLGNGERSGLPSEGHIAGARQLEWEQLFKDPEQGVFLERDELAKLFAERMAPGDTVVTYCLVGYRASMTYFVARMLGFPARMYDGSYQDWAKRALPVRKGPEP